MLFFFRMADLEDRSGETPSSIISLPRNGHYTYILQWVSPLRICSFPDSQYDPLALQLVLMARLVAEKAREIVTENGTVVKLTDLVGRKTEQGRNAILSRGEDWGLISISNSSGWLKVTN